jgi:hypothetical protein
MSDQRSGIRFLARVVSSSVKEPDRVWESLKSRTPCKSWTLSTGINRPYYMSWFTSEAKNTWMYASTVTCDIIVWYCIKNTDIIVVCCSLMMLSETFPLELSIFRRWNPSIVPGFKYQVLSRTTSYKFIINSRSVRRIKGPSIAPKSAEHVYWNVRVQ